MEIRDCLLIPLLNSADWVYHNPTSHKLPKGINFGDYRKGSVSIVSWCGCWENVYNSFPKIFTENDIALADKLFRRKSELEDKGII